MEILYTQNKSERFMLRLPELMKSEIKRIAEMDGISINSAIVQGMAHYLREKRANE